MTQQQAGGGRLKEYIEHHLVAQYLGGRQAVHLISDGDPYHCPTDAGTAEAIVAMDRLADAQDWQAVLVGLSLALKPGGRLLCNALSRDHSKSVADVDTPLAGKQAICAGDLARMAAAAGLSVVALVPYGTLFRDGIPNLGLKGSLAGDTHSWRRYLSWMEQDDGIFELGKFLHENLFFHLGSAATERYFVVLEKGTNLGSDCLSRLRGLNRPEKPLRLADILAEKGGTVEPAAWKEQFERLTMVSLRTQIFVFRLLSAVVPWSAVVNYHTFLSDRLAAAFHAWLSKEEQDRRVMMLASEWHSVSTLPEVLSYQGVPLAPGIEYELVQALVEDYNALFVRNIHE
jgi:hypothetical protein